MKAALLPGGSALGALAIEGGNMAALLPAAEAVEKTKELVSKVTEEVGGVLAVVGQEVMVVAQQVKKCSALRYYKYNIHKIFDASMYIDPRGGSQFVGYPLPSSRLGKRQLYQRKQC
jgi:hypothetical protein